MATFNITVNNLDVTVSGVNGYVDSGTYTNLDPVDYIFETVHEKTGSTLIYTFKANTTSPTAIDGFRRYKTDETRFKFLGAVVPPA